MLSCFTNPFTPVIFATFSQVETYKHMGNVGTRNSTLLFWKIRTSCNINAVLSKLAGNLSSFHGLFAMQSFLRINANPQIEVKGFEPQVI